VEVSPRERSERLRFREVFVDAAREGIAISVDVFREGMKRSSCRIARLAHVFVALEEKTHIPPRRKLSTTSRARIAHVLALRLHAPEIDIHRTARRNSRRWARGRMGGFSGRDIG
jgi:hypothetical protein